MAAHDDDRGQTPDPWDEIVADGLGDGPGEISFGFEDVTDAPAGQDPLVAPADPERGEAAGNAEPAADDALVEHWLSGGDGDGEAGPADQAASASPFDDHASGSSAIEIGTGGSGVALHGRPEQEEIGAVSSGGEPSAELDAVGWPGADATAGGADEDGAAGGGFPELTVAGSAAGAVVAAGGAGKPARLPARPAKKKSGGIGQLIGIVLGGAMAIPITLAILIYGLGKDPFGVTKQVPEQVAFLLPEKFRPGYKKPATPKPGAAEPSALDDLPAVAVSEPAEPAVEPGHVEPAQIEPGDVVAPAGEPEMPVEPEPAPATDVAAVDVPLPDLDGLTPPPAPAEPLPLDTAALDEAVGEAAALCEAIGAVDDRGSRAYNKLRTRWYRALAHVAEQLVAVEHASVTSGRPLDGVPGNVAALHGTIGGREDLQAELAALAPDWLAYANRGSDGIILPVTFESARRVGPFWATRVSLAGGDGAPRDFTVISRSEPSAVAGDPVIVTGVALDGAVIWAADVRGSGGGDLSAGF